MPQKKKKVVKTKKHKVKTADQQLAKLSYRRPLTYSFVRESMPDVLPFSIIPAGGGFPAIGYLNFENLQFNQLASAVAEFGAIFARYKVDKIETILTPMFQEQVASNNNVGYSTSSGLRITRVNTKWLNEPFNIQASADAQLGELAQIQAKSVRSYASRNSMKLITKFPRVAQRGVLDSTSTEIDVNKPMPWLNIQNQADVALKHNSLIFAERTDGGSLTADWKYHRVHKIYFRCSQVG
jgi:hypothetical protein